MRDKNKEKKKAVVSSEKSVDIRRRSKLRKAVIAVIAAAVLVAAVFLILAFHGEIWYPLFHPAGHGKFPDPVPDDLTEIFRSETAFEDLEKDERAEFNDSLMLINYLVSIPDDYEPDVTVYNGAVMYPDLVDAYVRLRDDAQAATGTRIFVSASFRTREEQMAVMEESEEGVAALPGHSEHEAGLALDVYAPYYAGKTFLRSKVGRWVNDHCAEYGFVIRYPKGKEDVTGITYEPWHLRYVGEPHALVMSRCGLTLEEYVELLTVERWYQIGDGIYVIRTVKDTVFLPDEWTRATVSPDNLGQKIVTVWTK